MIKSPETDATNDVNKFEFVYKKVIGESFSSLGEAHENSESFLRILQGICCTDAVSDEKGTCTFQNF